MTIKSDFLIGQLIMADFGGIEPSAAIRRLIGERGLGGVILFKKNVQTPSQVARLSRELQRLAHKAGSPRLLIAIDQEGGPVERIPSGLPSAMALGATRSPTFAETAGRILGKELRAVGVNINFAPVLDVNNNPENPIIGIRAFGEEPDLVSRLGRAFSAGMQREGVIATGKHFPGHGDVMLDSHHHLPVVTHSLERLETVEFRPFKEAIQDGVGALMTAHIAFPLLDDGNLPATIAPKILQGMLREQWGFGGVIFTDSLLMKPIYVGIGSGRAAVQALLAGADVLLACGGPEVQEEIFRSVGEAVEKGVVPRERVMESVRRIEALRGRMYAEAPDSGEADGVVGSAEHSTRARDIAEHAVTLVRNERGHIPVKSGRRLRVVTLVSDRAGWGPVSGDDHLTRGYTLGHLLREFNREVDELVLGQGGTLDAGFAADGALIVVTHSRGRMDPWQVEVVQRAFELVGDRLIVMATGNPYDLVHFPQVSTFLVTYGRERVMLTAAARLLLGEISPYGRLPVSIPGLYRVGHGLVW